MVSHQPRIQFGQVSDTSVAEDCLQLSCPSLLARASTAISLEGDTPMTGAHVVTRIPVRTESQQTSSVQTVERRIQQTSTQSPAPVKNLFMGPSYWDKVASSKVYPKYLNWDGTEEKLKQNTPVDQEDSLSKQSQNQSLDDEFIYNMELSYDSESEWFDTDCSDFEKCLSE